MKKKCFHIIVNHHDLPSFHQELLIELFFSTNFTTSSNHWSWKIMKLTKYITILVRKITHINLGHFKRIQNYVNILKETSTQNYTCQANSQLGKYLVKFYHLFPSLFVLHIFFLHLLSLYSFPRGWQNGNITAGFLYSSHVDINSR